MTQVKKADLALLAPIASRRAFMVGAMTLPLLGACDGQPADQSLAARLIGMELVVPLYSGIPRLGLLAQIATRWEFPAPLDSDPISDLVASIFDSAALEDTLAPLRAMDVTMPPTIPLPYHLADHASQVTRFIEKGHGDREDWLREWQERLPAQFDTISTLTGQMAFPHLAAEQALAGLRMARMVALTFDPGPEALARLDGGARTALADKIIQETRGAPDDPTLPGLQPAIARQQAGRCLMAALVMPVDETALSPFTALYDSPSVRDFTRALITRFAGLNDARSRAMILKFIEQQAA